MAFAEQGQKYRISYKTADGREQSEFVVMVPNPGDPQKVKEQLLRTRDDLKLKGVTADTLTVDTPIPQTSADAGRVGRIMSGITGTVKH